MEIHARWENCKCWAFTGTICLVRMEIVDAAGHAMNRRSFEPGSDVYGMQIPCTEEAV